MTRNVYAFLIWDESWNSFNNCYVVIEDKQIILIDSGKTEHFGDPLPSREIMAEGKVVSEGVYNYLSTVSNNQEMREKHSIDLFVEGLKKLQHFDITF